MSQQPAYSDWIHAALREHEAALTRYAASMLGDTELARDVVQDTFLRLCAQRREAVGTSVRAWLYTVCRRRALDVIRKEARVNQLSDLSLAEQASHAAPPARAMAQETHARMLAALAELPAKQQEAIRLKFQAGLSYRQIAAVMELKSGYVGYLLHTGLKALRERLADGTGE